MLQDNAALASVHAFQPRVKEWLLILYATDGTKRYVDTTGDYAKACRDRNVLMEFGDYEKCWMIEKVPGR